MTANQVGWLVIGYAVLLAVGLPLLAGGGR
jgi:hypothetical protein